MESRTQVIERLKQPVQIVKKPQKFYMTDAEIARSYRQAKDQIYQVRVLAELNLKTISDMIDKLEQLGFSMERARQSNCQRHWHRTWTQDEIDKVMELHKGGMNLEQIGKALQRSKTSVSKIHAKAKKGEC